MTGWDLTRPEDAAKLKQRMKDRMAGKPHLKHYERIIVRKDGTEVSTEMSTTTTAWQGKKRPLAIIRDITERKQAEEEITKFKTISDRAGYGSAISDLEGNLIYVNESFAKMHGYAADELMGKNLSISHNEEQMEKVNRLKEQLRQEGSYVAEEVWHKRKDNSVFPTLMNGTLIRDEEEPLFMAATTIDITERKQAEEALRESQKQLGQIIDGIPGLIVYVDKDQRYLYVNKAYANWYGYSKETMKGMRIQDVLPREVYQKVAPNIDIVLRGKPVSYENQYITNRFTTMPQFKEGWRLAASR